MKLQALCSYFLEELDLLRAKDLVTKRSQTKFSQNQFLETSVLQLKRHSLRTKGTQERSNHRSGQAEGGGLAGLGDLLILPAQVVAHFVTDKLQSCPDEAWSVSSRGVFEPLFEVEVLPPAS